MRLQKLFAVTVLVAALVGLAMLVGENVLSSRKVLYHRLDSRAQTLADTAAALALPALKSGEPLDRRALRLLALLPSVRRIAVYDTSDRLVFQALPNGRETRPEGSLAVGAEVSDGGRRYGRVALWMNLESTEHALWRLSLAEMLLAPAILMLLAGTALYVGRVVGRHIERFAEALEERRPDTLSLLPKPLRGSELGAIARSFGTLQRTLEHEAAARRETERLRDEMAGMIVHDLRHPLAIVKTVLYLLRDPEFADMPPVKRGEHLGLAQRALGRLDDMITDILNYVRLNDPRLPLTMRRIRLRTFLIESAEEGRLVVEHSGRSFRTHLAPEALARVAVGDALILRRVVANLVQNAMDHSPEGSVITLAADVPAERPSHVAIAVRNTGPGISPGQMTRLFETGATSGETPLNLGLGLAFCRLAAERHGALIDARSIPGEGAAFTLSLPSTFDTDTAAQADVGPGGRASGRTT